MRREAAKPDWRTLGTSRTVLMVCRTLTSTIRLLETHDLFRGEFRLRFVFTVYDDGTRHSAGVERLLRDAGVDEIVPWSRIDGVEPDLTLTASENVDTGAGSGPVVVLPHGVGFNKYVTAPNGVRVAGLPSVESLRSGRLRVLLAHTDQDAQLRALCPEIAGHTAVTGDATLDRLAASVPLRDRYRRLLHAEHRRLVFVNSTWGREGGIGRARELPRRLLAELPADTHRICLALHPNVWAEYGPRALRVHLADELAAGLILLPPERGWHAALVAADLVIADHGSIGLYAAALGKPLLLLGKADETIPDTPPDHLARTAATLDPLADLAPQLDAATTVPPDLRHITSRVFDHRGEAVGRVRAELYRTVGLDPPGNGPLPRVPDPEVTPSGPFAFRVHTRLSAETLVLKRFPASVCDTGGHLVVTDDEENLRLTERAAVLCRIYPGPAQEAAAWCRAMLAAYPGSRVAVAGVDGGAVAVYRDGSDIRLTADADVPALGSVAYHLLTGQASALSIGDRTINLR